MASVARRELIGDAIFDEIVRHRMSVSLCRLIWLLFQRDRGFNPVVDEYDFFYKDGSSSDRSKFKLVSIEVYGVKTKDRQLDVILAGKRQLVGIRFIVAQFNGSRAASPRAKKPSMVKEVLASGARAAKAVLNYMAGEPADVIYAEVGPEGGKQVKIHAHGQSIRHAMRHR